MTMMQQVAARARDSRSRCVNMNSNKMNVIICMCALETVAFEPDSECVCVQLHAAMRSPQHANCKLAIDQTANVCVCVCAYLSGIVVFYEWHSDRHHFNFSTEKTAHESACLLRFSIIDFGHTVCIWEKCIQLIMLITRLVVKCSRPRNCAFRRFGRRLGGRMLLTCL